ncbi:MAG: response regulator transcription factor [Thermocrinis sp.]|jgi:two-component system OmpR family response regulator/two-component system phosphate regulon response regulator PhoB|uniref:response regulator transcription factor n=1 Tax=Thermocrinis sp. TaxID=2024383 RepID=UPI003BFDA57A
MKVFLLEDDTDLLELLTYHLKKEGFEVISFSKGIELLERVKEEKPSLFILDVMVPSLDGFKVANILRSSPEIKDIPIIFLTAKTAEEDKLKGFELGADDYITKPFSIKELLARIRAVMRRYGALREGGIVRLGSLTVDMERMEVRRDREPINLTKTEFAILKTLLENYGKPVSREYLVEQVLKKEVYDRTIDVHVKKLREKLGKESEWIKTVRGVGYKLEEA